MLSGRTIESLSLVLTAHKLAFLFLVNSKLRCFDRQDLPIGVGIGPHSLLLSRLKAFKCLGPGDLKIGPCCGHEVIISSGPDDMGIRAIGLLQWV